MLKDGKNITTRKAFFFSALLVEMFAVLYFAIPNNPFLQKAVSKITGDAVEIAYWRLVQNSESYDQNLIKCRPKIAADKVGLHLNGYMTDGNANTADVLFDESVVLNSQVKKWLENLRSQGNDGIVSSEATITGVFRGNFSPGRWNDE